MQVLVVLLGFFFLLCLLFTLLTLVRLFLLRTLACRWTEDEFGIPQHLVTVVKLLLLQPLLCKLFSVFAWCHHLPWFVLWCL